MGNGNALKRFPFQFQTLLGIVRIGGRSFGFRRQWLFRTKTFLVLFATHNFTLAPGRIFLRESPGPMNVGFSISSELVVHAIGELRCEPRSGCVAFESLEEIYAVARPLQGRALPWSQTLKDYWFDWRTYNPVMSIYKPGLTRTPRFI
jgi:hypothetical protein